MSLRAFVETFPPLKVALYINDAICFVFSKFLDLVYYVAKTSFKLVYYVISHSFGPLYKCASFSCSKLTNALPPLRRFKEERERRKYERLKEQKEKLHDEPVPYDKDEEFVKRAITYHGGLVLALVMYIFVYFVLVKRHTYLSVSVATVLLLIYLVIVENSHNIRSILMLCLPIMFTNRGRALVFCSMLALLAGGPIRTMHHNVREIHTSLSCCKQYLIVNTDKYVGDNVVNKLVRVEEVVVNLVDNIKMFADDLKRKLDGIIQMAIDVELYVEGAISKLRDALNFCKNHRADVGKNCAERISALGAQCNSLLANSFGLCSIVMRLKDVCRAPSVNEVICTLPRHVVEFFRNTIGRKLSEYVDLIENEFYVDVDVRRSYAYNVTKSKSFVEVNREIKFDVEQKFWYVGLIRRAFNFVSLILVTWIFLTATIYHMHYLRELPYDNMYLDERLESVAYPERLELTPEHERLYLRPFSVHMNKFEMSKLYVSGLVWLVIVGYIGFFVLLDYSLYQLVHFLVETLREILFTSDLPLIDLESKTQRASGNVTEDRIVKYNRTYLSSLRKRFKTTSLSANMTSFTNRTDLSGDQLYTTNGTNAMKQTPSSTSSIQAFYDRLMESLERDIPDDVAILESLEGCLPQARRPYYDTYEALLYLALFTFGAVIVEAYALRTRHCIANLYYPRRARQRAKWLFRKIMAERPKYEEMDEETGRAVVDDADKKQRKRRGKDGTSAKTKRPKSGSLDRHLARPSDERLDDDDESQPLGYGFPSVE